MSGSPRTAAGRALLDRVSPPVGDNVDPEEEWVAEAWAHRNEIEGAILAIEAEAATPGESRTLVEAAIDEVESEHHDLFGHDNCEFDEAVIAIRSALRAALAEVPVIPDELGAAIDGMAYFLFELGYPFDTTVRDSDGDPVTPPVAVLDRLIEFWREHEVLPDTDETRDDYRYSFAIEIGRDPWEPPQ